MLETSFGLFWALIAALCLLVSCGNGEEEAETPTIAPASMPGEGLLTPTQQQFGSNAPLMPCYIDLAEAERQRPDADATPEVIELELRARPFRIVPSTIVLRQNRWYELAFNTGSEWYAFTVYGTGSGIDYEIPPNSRKLALVYTENAGVFPVRDWRRSTLVSESSAIYILPEGASTRTWNPEACGIVGVSSPKIGAELSAPLVIQGSLTPAPQSELEISRIEAWSNGELVGQTTEGRALPQGPECEFYLSVPSLTPGSHTIILIAYHAKGSIAATASFPLNILSSSPPRSLLPGYLGNIDLPDENTLVNLPATVKGWVTIPGSKHGTGVGAVEVWNGPRETGHFLTNATIGTYRADVSVALEQPHFATSGFFARLESLPVGEVDLHLYVRDREKGEYVSPRFRQEALTRRFRLAEGKVIEADWPVALAPAPDGRLFYAELLTGNIRILQDGSVLPQPFATLENVSNHGESGLLGLALHPDFPLQPFVYALYVVKDLETGLPSGQRVVRFRDADNFGEDYTVLLDNLPATKIAYHNAGRIAFGPDGKLYISIGDLHVPELAQDPTSLAGSILRFNPDGTIPDDNPLPGSPVYATGLRNAFGLAFQPGTGFLFATENGPGGFDEVNKIEAGRNYGWPTHMGDAKAEGFADPVMTFGLWPEPPIGPTGVTFDPAQPDLLLFCAFHGFSLRAVRLTGPDYAAAASADVISNNCALDVAYSSDGWLYYSSVSAIYRARLDDLLGLLEAGQ